MNKNTKISSEMLWTIQNSTIIELKTLLKYNHKSDTVKIIKEAINQLNK